MPRLADRTQTGIPGLDDLMDGGIPRGNLVVLAGDPGSGKTCFCIEYLYNGAMKYNEPGIYISLEETYDEIIRNGREFGYKLEELIEKKMLRLLNQINGQQIKIHLQLKKYL